MHNRAGRASVSRLLDGRDAKRGTRSGDSDADLFEAVLSRARYIDERPHRESRIGETRGDRLQNWNTIRYSGGTHRGKSPGKNRTVSTDATGFSCKQAHKFSDTSPHALLRDVK